MARGIDRSSPLPFYYQLKQLVLTDLRDRQLAAGDRLPGDHELCATYDVSRTVVRQALAELETEGVIQRVKGRGTFVAPERTSEHLVQSLTGLYEDVAARGDQLRSVVRRLEVAPADEQIAGLLELPVGARTIVLERLRLVDDEPWVLATTYLPYDVAPGLLDDDLTQHSLYALLEQKYGVELTHGRRRVEAEVASDTLAGLLGISPGAAVLVLRSTSYAGERPVEVFVAYHRGDRSRFEVTLKRTPPAESRPPLMHVTGQASV
ncbi:GntR family transcriptional regulator [Microlunatus antarcticus]|uniref:GntR family transcriptional regulator n=1 Tax=Microlunatus antarcticus TaxID=53388 RepID=A0A7W5P779_9ACTN|nr:GntR family transcriptional regulator [Microlunatus antarcticus]